MKCGACGGDHIVHETRDIERDYRGATLLIKGVSGKFCPDCGEVTMTRAESVAYMAKLKEARASINAGAHEAVLLESVRSKLGLTRKAAGEAFGGGVNAFSRYETGKTAAPKPLIQLFTLLHNHPELVYELNLPSATLPSEAIASLAGIDGIVKAVGENRSAIQEAFRKGEALAAAAAQQQSRGFYGGTELLAFSVESVLKKALGTTLAAPSNIHLRHG